MQPVVKSRLSAIILIACLLPLCRAEVMAGGVSSKRADPDKGWYIGLGAGVPFSVNSFSSFAPGGPYWGVTSGLSAGYRFNPLFSLEADLGLGTSSLAAQKGCLESNYFLSADGNLYNAAVLGQESWSVADFKSKVNYLRFGLSANFNLLHGLEGSRWRLELSPRISAYGTGAAMIPHGGGQALMESGGKDLHFGYGAALKASYRLSDRFSIGLGSGITALTGKGIDGIPDHDHKTNHIWETGLRLIFDLGPRNGAPRGCKACPPGPGQSVRPSE